jgi:pimeloyl-ACP methyl ester carboxylesterase
MEMTVGQRYEVSSGRRLWLHRSGGGGPAVVFLPGASAVGLDYLNLHERVAKYTTSVLYDRGGTGLSDPVTLPRSAEEVATELHELLKAAGIPAPYVLVAQSIGGAYVRRYLQLYGDEVAGTVHLDAFHEDWDSYMPPKGRITAQPVPSDLLLRLAARLSRPFYRKILASWPAGVREPLIANHTTLAGQKNGAAERSNLPALRDEIKAAGPVPERPLIALTALGIDPGMRLFRSKATLVRLNEGKRQLDKALAGSVANGEQRDVEGARHSTICVDRADTVAQAIVDLWRRVQ